MKKVLFASVFVLLGLISFAQRNSQINGRVLDEETGEPVIGANVYVEVGGAKIGSATDIDGNFRIKPLSAGTYNLTVSSMGMQTAIITGIKLNTSEVLPLQDILLKTKAILIGGDEGVIVIAYTNPLIRPDKPSIEVLDPVFIQRAPDPTDISAIAATVPGVQQSSDGQVRMRGAREGTNAYYVDGMRVKSLNGVAPARSIKSMEVYGGGVPAMYGDLTGGVIVIETNSYFDLYNQYNSGRR